MGQREVVDGFVRDTFTDRSGRITRRRRGEKVECDSQDCVGEKTHEIRGKKVCELCYERSRPACTNYECFSAKKDHWNGNVTRRVCEPCWERLVVDYDPEEDKAKCILCVTNPIYPESRGIKLWHCGPLVDEAGRNQMCMDCAKRQIKTENSAQGKPGQGGGCPICRAPVIYNAATSKIFKARPIMTRGRNANRPPTQL